MLHPDARREIEARFSMLETLADHDDLLMEQLLEEKEPPRDEVFDDLSADLRDGSVTPVLIGTAEKGNGVLRCFERFDLVEKLAVFECSPLSIKIMLRVINQNDLQLWRVHLQAGNPIEMRRRTPIRNFPKDHPLGNGWESS